MVNKSIAIDNPSAFRAKEILGWDPNVDLETLIKKVASEIQL